METDCQVPVGVVVQYFVKNYDACFAFTQCYAYTCFIHQKHSSDELIVDNN